VALGLASLGVKFSEEAVEPVTGYRVDMLLQGGGDGVTGRCAMEVGVHIVIAFVIARPLALSSSLLPPLLSVLLQQAEFEYVFIFSYHQRQQQRQPELQRR
jgi:hypothetical protein